MTPLLRPPNVHTNIAANGSFATTVRKTSVVVSNSWLGDAIVLGVLIVGAVTLHLAIPGIIPSGAEGGRYLAMANEMIGQDVMSAEISYPPLFLAPVALLLALGVSPIGALVTMALLAKIGLVVAVYLTVRTLNRTLAALAATLVATAAAQLDVYAAGGYAQLLGMAFGLLATFLIVRSVDTHERAHLWVGVGFLVATLVTNVTVGVMVAPALAVAIAHWLFITNPRRWVWIRGLRLGGIVVGATGLGAVLAYLVWQESVAGSVLAAIAPTRGDALAYVFRDAPWLWAALSAGGLTVLFFRFWPAHVAATVAVGASWMVTSGAYFLITGEPSYLVLLQVGLILLATVGLIAAREYWLSSEPTRQANHGLRSLGLQVSRIAIVSTLLALVVAGIGAYASATDWYRLVDRNELAALDELRAVAGPGQLAVVSRGSHDLPVGWWVEGYGETPSYSGADVESLSTPAERDQAEIATSIFGGELTDAETLATMDEIGAQFMVVDDRGPAAGFLDGELARSLPVVDASSHLVILDFR